MGHTYCVVQTIVGIRRAWNTLYILAIVRMGVSEVDDSSVGGGRRVGSRCEHSAFLSLLLVLFRERSPNVVEHVYGRELVLVV